MTTNIEPFVTKEEVRNHLKLPNIEAVERLMREKKIPFHRFGYRTTRLKISEVEAALSKLRVQEAATR